MLLKGVNDGPREAPETGRIPPGIEVHALHDASGRVPERGMREFDLPLPPELAKASLVARLVTRRLDGPLAEEARRLGAFVEPVEIWRGPVAPRP